MVMILVPWSSFKSPAKAFGGAFPRFPVHHGLSSANYPYTAFRSIAPVICPCLKSQLPHKSPESEDEDSEEGFSVLSSEIPWEKGSIWSTMALYMFCLHIPLGFSGLSIVAYILHQPVLDPQTQVLSLLLLEMAELSGTLFLLRNAAVPHSASIDFFRGCDSRKEKNWLLASAMGFAFLLSFIFITSLLLDQLLRYEAGDIQAVSDSEIKKMIVNGDVSRIACFGLYCILAPILEEIVYRRFLFTSLASTMSWNSALLISSGVFAGAHFSGENFVQLFIVGCVLGSCYSWSGNLSSSILLHSLYNAFTLFVLLLS